MGVNTQQLQGFDEAIAKLRAVPAALAKKTLRNGLAAGGRLVRDEAKRLAPVLQRPAPYRTKGLVRDRIALRTSKAARRAGNVGVFINVRPAAGARFKTKTTKLFGLKVRSRTQTRAGDRGAKSAKDPFYWRFQEFGWTPATGPRGNAGKKARRTAKRAGAGRQIPGKHFLTRSGRKLPEALGVIRSYLQKWVAKTNSSGKVVP